MPLSHDQLTDLATAIGRSPAGRGEIVCARTADQFENDLMEVEGLPRDHFEFLQRLLSEQDFYRQPGLWNFLMALSAGRHRLEPSHFQQLEAIFRAKYASYEDADLSLAVCDFVARNFPHAEARRLLMDLRGLEGRKSPDLRGLADEGLQILENEIARTRS